MKKSYGVVGQSISSSKARSMAKTITWRITATLTTVIIAVFITKELTLALSIGGIEFFAKILIYYLHERGWERINYGIVKPPDYNI